MQYLLSGYANWYAKRHQRTGHLFQGRFKGELIEDDSYFWTVSRYIHLNPVRGKHPRVKHPRDWPWSSYPSFAAKRGGFDWLAKDELLAAWQGEVGGKDPLRAYRRFVEQRIADPPANPLLAAWEGWLLGSEKFRDEVKRRIKKTNQADQVPLERKLRSPDAKVIVASVAAYYQVNPQDYRLKRGNAPGRDLAAYLAHRWSTATLRSLAPLFGLGHPDSMSNLIRRAEGALSRSSNLKRAVSTIEKRLKTENRV